MMEHNKVVNSIWQEILDTRSLTVIEYKIQVALEINSDLCVQDMETLTRMLETNKLDLIWALAHEQLGNPDQTKVLRDFVANKEAKLRS